jgi:hypothetical protein
MAERWAVNYPASGLRDQKIIKEQPRFTKLKNH